MLQQLYIFVFCVILAVPLKGEGLPFNARFKGVDQFKDLLEEARDNQWDRLPIGKRCAAVGKALVGTPYKNYTLEIDDKIEAPSVNFEAMDCWTFFEIALAFSRLLDEPSERQTPETLLAYIEQDRYRAGKCTGYLSRLHYLEDWMEDNEKRGLVRNITKDLGYSKRIYSTCREMTLMWKSYRYLRNSPELLPEMARIEERVSSMEVYHIPKSKVPLIEDKLQDGDIICITTNQSGGFTSHVGIAVRDDDGVLRFMHASSNYRKVALDMRLSDYLNKYRYHAGIIAVRPVK